MPLLGIVLSGSCQGGSTASSSQPEALRVATKPTVTLDSLVPRSKMGFSSAATELVYRQFGDEVTVVETTGSTVKLKPHERSMSLDELASNVRFVGLVSTRVDANDGVVVVELDSPSTASDFAREGALATGSYKEAETGARLLHNKLPNRPTIEFVPGGASAHWQFLIGGHVEVAPLLTESDAKRLAHFKSVTTVAMSSDHTLSLYLGLRVGPEARSALASIVAGEAMLSTSNWVLPTIYLAEDDPSALTEFRRLANRVWQASGKRPEAVLLPLKEMQERVTSGSFTAMIAPVPSNLEQFLSLLLPGEYLGKTGLLSEEGIEAVRRKDWDRAKELLAATVIPLRVMRSFVAYDHHWCAAGSPTPYSWAWISELKRCEVLQ